MKCYRLHKHSTPHYVEKDFKNINEEDIIIPPLTSVTDFKFGNAALIFGINGFDSAYLGSGMYTVASPGTTFVMVQD